jgi:hypothetical protein
VCALAVIVIAADQVAAQDRGAIGEPTGVRESARLLDEADTTRAAFAPGVKPVWLFLPSYVSSEGLRLPGGAFGLVVKSKIPVQLRVGYKRQDFTESADRNQFAVDGKSSIVSGGATNVALLAEYRRTPKFSQKYKVGAAIEHTFVEKLTVGASVDYLRALPNDGSSTGDVAPAVGISFSWDALETSVDYAFKNDVDGEDDYSFTLSHKLVDASATGRGPVLLVFGVGKGRTIFGTLRFSFTR